METNRDQSSVLDELSRLDDQIGWAPDLEALKPIYYRIEEIGNEFPSDSGVQAQVSGVKQHLVTRGRWLKQQNPGAANAGPLFDALPPQVASSTPAAEELPVTGPYPAIVPGQSPFVSGQQAGPQYPAPTPDPMRASGQMPLETPREVYVPPVWTPPPPIAPEPPPQPPINWKKPVLIGGGIGLLLAAGVIGVLAYLNRHKNEPLPPPPPSAADVVKVEIATVPPGADIQVNKKPTCKSNCAVDLKPGQYSLLAVLPGYEQAIQNIDVEKAHPLSLSLTLTPQAVSVKILTDLVNAGKVLLDNQPNALQEGQIVLERVAAGPHELKITGDRGSEVKFSIQVTPGAAPAINGAIATKNLSAVLASALGNKIHVVTSITPMKVSLDGKPMGDAGPDGIDLTDVAQSDHELGLNVGKDDERKLTIAAPFSPTLTVWVNANTSGGTLVVNAGEDGATVLIDGQAYPKKTRRGQVWIPNLPPKDYKVRVTKEGLQDAPEQTATVKKGAETRLSFKLPPPPQIAGLRITGGTPGAHVLIDSKTVGQVDPDGSFSHGNITPGQHTIEVRREQYTSKITTQTFRPGETLDLSGDSVILERPTGTLNVSVTPNTAQITIKPRDEGRSSPILAGPHSLPAGFYTLVAKAPGFADATETVQVKPGEVVTADLKPVKEATVAKEGGPQHTGPDWEHPEEWKLISGWRVHTGGNFVPYSAQPSTGTFTFTVQLLKGHFLGHHIQWRVDCRDDKNYVLYTLDKKSLESKIFVNGRASNRPRVEIDAQEPFTLQIEITPDSIVHRLLKGGQYAVIDTLPKAGAGTGKFGFFIPKSDEVGIADFKFTPR